MRSKADLHSHVYVSALSRAFRGVFLVVGIAVFFMPVAPFAVGVQQVLTCGSFLVSSAATPEGGSRSQHSDFLRRLSAASGEIHARVIAISRTHLGRAGTL